MICGGLSILMLFIIPFIIHFFFRDLGDNKTFSIVYFIIFLCLLYFTNSTSDWMEKNPPKKEEERDYKLNKLLGK